MCRMYGVFAVRIVEGGNLASPSAAISSHPPSGHTEYSWPADGGGARIPAGHTAFSWGAAGASGGGSGVSAHAACWLRGRRVAGLTDCLWLQSGGDETADAAPRREAWGDPATDLDLEGQRRVDIYCGNPMVQTIRARVHLYTRRYDLMGGGAPPASGPATPSPRGVGGGSCAGGGPGPGAGPGDGPGDGEPEPTWRSISEAEPESVHTQSTFGS